MVRLCHLTSREQRRGQNDPVTERQTWMGGRVSGHTVPTPFLFFLSTLPKL